MKVAQVATRYPPGPGGVERHVAELAPRLAVLGHEVDVFTTDLYREFPWEPLPSTVPRRERTPFGTVNRLRAWSLPGELHYTFFRGLGRALARTRPTLIHAHTYGTHQVAVARRYHRSTGTPYVVTAHFHPIWSIEGGWLRRRLRSFYDRRLAGRVLADAARIIVQTKEEERLLRSLPISIPPTTIIPPGYTPLPAPADGDVSFAERYGIPGPFALFVGRLASNKGLPELIEAFAPLARRDPTATLVLAGEDTGMAGAVDERVHRLDLGDRVRRIGFVAEDRLLASAYHEARVTVLPSEYEAFGLVLLESLSQGTPVVASRVGGIPEVIEDGKAGLLVPPRDSGALTEALERVWADPELARRMGSWGRAEVVPRYTWESVAARIDTVYREVVGR